MYRIFILVFGVIIFFSSCKKDLKSVSLFESKEKIQNDLQEYLELKTKSNFSEKATLDTMKAHSLWENIQTIDLNKEEILYYIPINYNNNLTGFVFIKSKQTDSVTKSYLSEIKIKENLNNDSPVLIISRIFSQGRQTFSGALILYTTDNKFLFEEGFENGIFKYRKKIFKGTNVDTYKNNSNIKSNSINAFNVKSNSCTVFYEVTYWSDNTVDYQILDIVCDSSPCEQTRVIDKKEEIVIKSFCLTGIGGSGGGTSSSSSELSNIFLLSDTFAWQYPKFYQLIKSLSISLQGKYLNSLITLSNITGLSQEKILDIVKMGRGPRIEMKDLNPNPNLPTIFGRFDKINNVIYIDQQLLELYESPYSKYSEEAMTFFMTVTVLHETTHYGINQNINLFSSLISSVEFGNEWEFSTFRQYIDDPTDAQSYILKMHP